MEGRRDSLAHSISDLTRREADLVVRWSERLNERMSEVAPERRTSRAASIFDQQLGAAPSMPPPSPPSSSLAPPPPPSSLSLAPPPPPSMVTAVDDDEARPVSASPAPSSSAPSVSSAPSSSSLAPASSWSLSSLARNRLLRPAGSGTALPGDVFPDAEYRVTKLNNLRVNGHSRSQPRILRFTKVGVDNIKGSRQQVVTKHHAYEEVAACYMRAANRLVVSYFADHEFVYQSDHEAAAIVAELQRRVTATKALERAQHGVIFSEEALRDACGLFMYSNEGTNRADQRVLTRLALETGRVRSDTLTAREDHDDQYYQQHRHRRHDGLDDEGGNDDEEGDDDEEEEEAGGGRSSSSSSSSSSVRQGQARVRARMDGVLVDEGSPEGRTIKSFIADSQAVFNSWRSAIQERRKTVSAALMRAASASSASPSDDDRGPKALHPGIQAISNFIEALEGHILHSRLAELKALLLHDPREKPPPPSPSSSSSSSSSSNAPSEGSSSEGEAGRSIEEVAAEEALVSSLANTIRPSIEQVVLLPLRKIALRHLNATSAADELLLRRYLVSIQNNKQGFFGIAARHQSSRNWHSAVYELRQCLEREPLPSRQLDGIVATALAIYSEHANEHRNKLQRSGGGRQGGAKKKEEEEEYQPLAADDLLPIFVFVVAKACLPRQTNSGDKQRQSARGTSTSRIGSSASSLSSSSSSSSSPSSSGAKRRSDPTGASSAPFSGSGWCDPLHCRDLLWALGHKEALRSEAGYYLTSLDAALELLLSQAREVEAELLDDSNHRRGTTAIGGAAAAGAAGAAAGAAGAAAGGGGGGGGGGAAGGGDGVTPGGQQRKERRGTVRVQLGDEFEL